MTDSIREAIKGLSPTQALTMFGADHDEGDVTNIVEPACGIVAMNKAIEGYEKGGGHLLGWTPSQRALLGARAVRSKHGGNRRGKRRDDGGRYMYIDAEGHHVIANSLGVSVRQLRAAIRLLRSEGAAELIEAVGSGLISVHDALFAIDAMTPESYGKAVEYVRAGHVRTIRAVAWLVDAL